VRPARPLDRIYDRAMSLHLRHYISAVYGLDHVLRLVDDATWDAPSPCDGWSVRDVTGHAIGVVSNVAGRCGMGELIDVFVDPPGAIAGNDPYAKWLEIRHRVTEALDQPGVLQRELTWSVGTTTIDEFLSHMCADAVIHTWDIARGAGVDERLDASLVTYVDGVVRARGDGINRAPKRYLSELEAGESADAQTRLLAYSGRSVAR
jgi:uncharacterized protein (TIGR03086 family)